MSNKTWLVAQREYIENIRTKAFWFGILSFPIILLMMGLIPTWLDKAKDARKYSVIDRSGWLLAAVDEKIAKEDPTLESAKKFVRVPATDSEADLARLNREIDSEKLFGYFVIEADPLNSPHPGRFLSSNLTDRDLFDWFGGMVSEAIRDRKVQERQIDPEVAAWLQAPTRFDVKKVGKAGEEDVRASDFALQWAPVAFVYLLWICIFTTSQMLLTNTIEEKSNRIMEVLLSSISPIQLMAGKITGIAATGLTMTGSWVLCFIVGGKLLPKLIGAQMPFDLGSIATNPLLLGSFLGYFLLGYLLYAALLVGIGAVCNSLKEAQNLMSPITMLLLVPLAAMVPVAKNPNGTLAKVLSFFPPFTPFAMMNRAAGPPALWEYIATTVLLVAAVVLALYGAAKIFRIGILMTGKPPKLGEILRWLRAPVGQVPTQPREESAS